MALTPKKNIFAEQKKLADHDLVFHVRTRFTIAEINAGAQLLPAVRGKRYRVVDASMIAIGGAVGGATSVDIKATQSVAAVNLLAVAIAALTQNALVRAGAANAAILAGGVSLSHCDKETAITVGKTGGTAITATHVDIAVWYTIET